MNELKALRIRDHLEIEIPKASDRGRYSSRVQDVTEAYLAIDVPRNQQGHTFQDVGSRLTVRFHANDRLYEFESEILEHREERIPLTLIRKPKTIRQIERRKDYRVDCLIPVECQSLSPRARPPFKGTIVNISMGGARISSRIPMEAGSFIRIAFDLPGVQAHIEAQGKIVHVLNHPPSKQFLLTMFWKLDKRTQTKIYRFAMARQLDLRRKGILLSEEGEE